jgi:O-methyltransferase involved in polyketide biosynthesis
MDMAITHPDGSNEILETLLIPLYIRALESQRLDALIKDENAVALTRQMDQRNLQNALVKVQDETRVAIVLRNRQFDFYTRDFLMRYPNAVVVHIGCGLDARFARVDNGKVEWYDLDLPEVIELRSRLVGGEMDRYHLLAGSVLDETWLNAVGEHRQRPFLFLAEGVFMYLTLAQLKLLVLNLQNKFPGAEIVFDAFSPFFAWAHNLRVDKTKIGARCHWAIMRGQELEQWSDGIQLLDEWFPFEQPEPRLGAMRYLRWIPLLTKTMRVLRYRLGAR